MTLDSATPFQTYTVAGTGPYAAPWPYAAGSIGVAVADDAGVLTPLDPADFTVTPAAATVSGNITLTAPMAALHAGRTLTIERTTPDEQGWAGTQSAREAGLEAQLDQLVMAVQELRSAVARTLRSTGALPLLLPGDDGTVLVWQDGGLASGPDADAIAAAQANAEIAAAAAAAAATFDPALYLSKAGNLAGLTNVVAALTDGLGFSAYMAGLRGLASKTALRDELVLPGIGIVTEATFLTNYNDTTLPTGLYWVSNTATGRPLDEFCALIQMPADITGSRVQIAVSFSTNRMFVRTGVAGGWTEIGVGRRATVATVSGSAFDFTNIPAGVNRIQIGLLGVSLSGTDALTIQLGAGAIQTTGYVGNRGYLGHNQQPSIAAVSNAFFIGSGNAASELSGVLTLTRVDTRSWVISGSARYLESVAAIVLTTGGVSLAGVLDRIRISAAGANTFDAGAITVSWEF